MNTRILIAASILLASLAVLPTAAAADPCASLPEGVDRQQCYELTKPLGNLEQCNGGDKGYQQCLAGQCNQLAAADPGTRVNGCSELACDTPDWSVTPEGGDDCLDMICRNVPPVFETIKVQTLGVAGLLGLGGLPGGEVLVRVLKNAGFYCERGTGDGGPGSPCQRVLWTPVGSVGADPEGVVNTAGETAWECSWAQSGFTGYNYVGTKGNEFGTLTGDCGVKVGFYVVLGTDSHWYQLSDGCSA